MNPGSQMFQGVIAVFGGQTSLQQNTVAGPVQTLILRNAPGNLGSQIAAATAIFQPFAGTIQTLQGTLTVVAGQRAILIA